MSRTTVMPNISTFTDAREMLAGRDRMKIANNTWLESRGAEGIAVRLHATDIVLYRPDGRITLDSGGYQSVTTLDRMNTALREAGISVDGSSQSGWTGKRPKNWREWTVITPDDAFDYHDGITI